MGTCIKASNSLSAGVGGFVASSIWSACQCKEKLKTDCFSDYVTAVKERRLAEWVGYHCYCLFRL